MAETIRRVSYYHVEVPDKPGEGARVFGALQQQGVNLLALSAFPVKGGKSQIDLVAGSGELEAAAAKAGLKLSSKKSAFFITGDDRPGAVAAVLKKLADAKINVIATNAACGQTGFGMLLWVKPADLDAAAKVLGG
jgi:predicted amino acid-binding ACT domain protein